MALTPGSRLGPYEVVGSIGAGGMGEVYRARDTRLDRDVALKILPESFAADPERLARFEREAKTLASLNHPNIAQIYGSEDSSGKRALVMELVEGEDLSHRIARGAIPIDEALPIARQIAAALEAAHDLGIIHRDLKPANVKLRPDGTVKVLDFGLAKALDRADVSGVSPALANSPTITTPAMTQAGMILGTAAYMSPEQAKGRVVDRRTDLWAFGCVLFEMLTGKRAFAGDDVTDTLTAIFRDEPQWPALPADTLAPVQRLLRRCLQKDRARRLDSAAMARIELDEPAPPDTPPVARRRQASPWLWVLGATTIASLIVAAILITRPAVFSEAPVIRFTLPLPSSVPFRTIPGGVAVAISPDGKNIVYTSGTQGELVRRRLDGDDFEVFKERGTAPFFSPDSKWIGFFSDGRLKTMPIEGGLATTVCNTEVGRGPWGDDGSIIFANTSGLLRVPSGGGSPQRILPGQSFFGTSGVPQPVFLPGSRIVLLATRDETERIRALTLADGTLQDLVEGVNPIYADDRQVVFVKDNQMWAAPFDSKQPALRGPPAPVLEGFRMQGPYALAAAASNGTIVYVPGSSLARSTMVWLDRKGQATLALPEPDAYLEPRLSPDGKRVAVAITKSSGNDLWVHDLARGTKLRLTSSGNNTRPRWTPDGLRLAFLSEGDIYARRADATGAAEPVLVHPSAQFPDAWVPDGKSLIYNEGGAIARGLWTLQIGQQPVRLLPESPFNERSGSVSPDGKWLAFVSNESGRDEVYVQPFPGPGAKVAISTDGGFAPVWSRNGRELFYRRLDELMAVRIDNDPTRAGSPRRLFDFPTTIYGRDPNRVEYDVAPDGRFLAIRADARSTGEEIRVVTNWLANRMRAAATTRP